MKFIRTVIALLGVIILSLQPISALATTKANIYNNVDKAYNFTITPEMKSEWSKLKTLEDKLEVCQIPNDILQSMSTKALVETVSNFPLSVNLYAYDTLELGYKMLKDDFNGLAELEKRMKENPELTEALINSRIAKMKSEQKIDISTGIQAYSIDVYFTERIKECLLQECDYEKASINSLPRSVISTYVKTPKGSNVKAYKNLTWDDHLEVTESEAIANHKAVKNQYPSVSIISGINPKYNCHSYAWHSTSTSNIYWIDNPSPYINDGSYIEASRYKVGSKLVYIKNGKRIHSAIIAAVSDNHLTYVKSKWGTLGVYKHLYFDCPYSRIENASIKDYKLA